MWRQWTVKGSSRDLFEGNIPELVSEYWEETRKLQSWSKSYAKSIGPGVVAMSTCVYKTVLRRTIRGVLCAYHEQQIMWDFEIMAVKITLLHLCVVTPSSALKVEKACFSDMLISTYKSTRRHNPEKHHQQKCMTALCMMSVLATYHQVYSVSWRKKPTYRKERLILTLLKR
jgi:hypothetical protein